MAQMKVNPTTNNEGASVAEADVRFHAFHLVVADDVAVTLIAHSDGEVCGVRTDLISAMTPEVVNDILAEMLSDYMSSGGSVRVTARDVRAEIEVASGAKLLYDLAGTDAGVLQ